MHAILPPYFDWIGILLPLFYNALDFTPPTLPVVLRMVLLVQDQVRKSGEGQGSIINVSLGSDRNQEC
jgi:hypothetical protein